LPLSLNPLRRVNRNMQLYYATHDGQARRVAERIAGRLAERGVRASPEDLSTAFPTAEKLAEARLATIVSAVRYGRHLPVGRRFLSLYRSLRAPPPLAFISVCLAARKPGRDTAEGNPYLRKALAKNRLAPALALAIAGRLDYPRYGWLDRQMIRLIMTLTRGPTDPTTTIEYTPWDVVDDVALRIADLFDRTQPRQS
jgi:menaquinone-dependent protoporphyrinogen oxidase